jgi:hypothetical protein
MSDCPYYRVHKMTLRSREIRSDQQVSDVKSIPIPWCAHPHSPVPKSQATATIGGASLLRCDGLLAKCQVAPDKRGNIKALE